MVILGVGIALFIGCGEDDNGNNNVEPPQLINYNVVDSCITGTIDSVDSIPAILDTTIEVTVDGCTIHTTRIARFNCCMDSATIELSSSGERITVIETDHAIFSCKCICGFETSFDIIVHEARDYILGIYRAYDWDGAYCSETTLVWMDTVSVTDCP